MKFPHAVISFLQSAIKILVDLLQNVVYIYAREEFLHLMDSSRP